MTPYQDALDKLDALYAMIPDVQCQGHCAHACQPLAVSHLERVRLERVTGRRLRAHTAPMCPLLQDGRCRGYRHRPAICRLYGVTENMQCGFGCVPERVLAVSEWDAILHAIEEVSQAIYPGRSTVSFHTAQAIIDAQEKSAEALCAFLLKTVGSS